MKYSVLAAGIAAALPLTLSKRPAPTFVISFDSEYVFENNEKWPLLQPLDF